MFLTMHTVLNIKKGLTNTCYGYISIIDSRIVVISINGVCINCQCEDGFSNNCEYPETQATPNHVHEGKTG